MKIMVLGSKGMLGHMVCDFLRSKGYNVVDEPPIRIQSMKSMEEYIQEIHAQKPTYVINCLGVVKPRIKEVGVNHTYLINSVFPMMLYINKPRKTSIIHISSDCVWSGKKPGLYTINDLPDAEDDYGKSKALGEFGDYVLRTSIIGPELNGTKRGLFENILSSEKLSGWDHHKWSGVTTLRLAQYIEGIIIKLPAWKNKKTYLIGSPPMSKYELVQLINTIFELGKDVEYVTDNNFVNRSFKSDLNKSMAILQQLVELKEWMKDNGR